MPYFDIINKKTKESEEHYCDSIRSFGATFACMVDGMVHNEYDKDKFDWKPVLRHWYQGEG